MSYAIRKLVLGPAYKKHLEISAKRFESIVAAKDSLVEVIEVEELFHTLAENFVELELDALNSSFRYAIFHNLDYITFSLSRSHMNRRLSNFLSSVRAYLDRLERFSKRKEDKQLLVDPIKSARSQAYDNNLSYRFLEGLRNHTQHYGHGIRSLTFSSRWVDREAGEAIRNVPLFHVDTDEIERAKLVKKSIIEELRLVGKKVNLKVHIKRYVSLLGEIHSEFQKLFRKRKEEIDSEINSAIQEYLSLFPDEDPPYGLHVLEHNSRGEVVKKEVIFTKLIELRKHFEDKNKYVKAVEKICLQ